MSWTAVNPATGETLEAYPEMSGKEVEEILQAAHRAQRSWRSTRFPERARTLRRAAEILRERSEEYGRLMTREMGKPLKEARGEVEKCAWVCEYYADNGEEQLAPEPVDTPETEASTYVAFQPIGLVLAIMPWNFPFWQVFRFAAPNLMAGNGGILKHASSVPGCALAIEEVLHDAGFPPELFRSVIVDRDLTGRIIEHPLVRGVTLTGSVGAGKAVASQAGGELKKTVMELGGSDPYIILEDADLDATVEACVTSRMMNSGQSCIAAKRFLVVESLREEFERRMVEGMSRAVMGDPMDEETTLGPQARLDLRDELHRQVRESVEAGARLLLGGEPPEGPGAFYPPTVLTDVEPGMPAYDEELFGPVASIIEVGDEREAIRVANDTSFGLGGAIFTADRERGERLAVHELDAGACFVNAFVRSDPRLPFGGVKESGYGRELSLFGIREFVNIKTVWVE
ncbi:MAG: NAD-dependent succinate-semialdehyde dehydrogenase [Gemmatimonadales bacterium]|nr:MAG: NAD-dependent succinate-semialdehyde dehydrogenase [Gemmatimonadales bacterium]